MTDPLAPIPVEGEIPAAEIDLFGAYRHLVPIMVAGVLRPVPESNSVLRALQYLELKHGCVTMEWGRYCWNDTEGCCQMVYRPTPGAEPRAGRACVVQADAGLEIVQLPPGGRAQDEEPSQQ